MHYSSHQLLLLVPKDPSWVTHASYARLPMSKLAQAVMFLTSQDVSDLNLSWDTDYCD
jgi:hypothetical protein